MLIIGETRWGSKWKLYYLHKFSVNLKKFILKLNYFCRGKGSDRVLLSSPYWPPTLHPSSVSPVPWHYRYDHHDSLKVYLSVYLLIYFGSTGAC
jgi:hypothetical protein